MACSPGKPHRVSGFTIRGNATFYITGACTDFRIDHNRFENIPNGTEAVFFNMGESLVGEIYGLVDNNVFTTTGTNFRAILIRGNIDYGKRS